MATTYSLSGSENDATGGTLLTATARQISGYVELSEPSTTALDTGERRLGTYPISFSGSGFWTVPGLPATDDPGWMPKVQGIRTVTKFIDPGTKRPRVITSPWFELTADSLFSELIEAEQTAVQTAYDAANAAADSAANALASKNAAAGSATAAADAAGAVGSIADNKAAAIAAETGAQTARTAAEAARDGAVAIAGPVDGTVAGLVNNTGGIGPLTSAALSATIDAEATPIAAQQVAIAGNTVYDPRTVFDGDSVTIGSIVTLGGNQNRADSWTVECARLSMGRIKYLHNAAVAGRTSQMMLDNFDSGVAPHAPKTVIAVIGTNDIGQSVPMATWLANLDLYLAKCKAIGARLILGAIWPTDQTSVIPTRGATARAWNKALRTWAAARNIDVIPFDLLADVSTGGWATAWTADQIHPGQNGLGLSAIGKFAWDYLAPKFGPAQVRRARCQGDGLFSNGFFTSLTAGIDGGAVQTSSSVAATTGTVPAGDYAYRITARTQYGESGQYVDKTITLAAPGGVTVTRSINNYYNAWVVYRKGPGETAFKYMATIGNGTATWTDDGTVTPGYAYVGGNSSIVPTGLTTAIGSSSWHSLKFGGPVQTDPAIRGNFLRLGAYTSGTTDTSDFFEITGLTAGQALDFSCLARTSGGTYGQVILRWRDASTALSQTAAERGRMDNGWGLLYLRSVVPTGATRVRISIELDDTADYIDVAEILLDVAA